MEAWILEDEKPAASRLARMVVEEDSSFEVTEIHQSVKSLVARLTVRDFPDVLFLDIHVADGNSFELFDLIEVPSSVIFTTAYDQYAIRALRADAADYLLKPIKREELKKALEKVRSKTAGPSRQKKSFRSRFLIRAGNKIRIVRTSDLAFAYSENKLTYLVTWKGDRLPSDLRLQDLENDLPPDLYFRVNRQYIVHHDAIAEMHTYSKSRVVLLLNPPVHEKIVVSSETTPKLKKWLDR